jgi:hypothetical protein
VACSRAEVTADSGTDATEAGGSRAVRLRRSRGERGTNKWASAEGGAQPQRERRRERGGHVGPVFKFNPKLIIQTV